ncbi:MAG: hypothetical protein LBJ84_07255 [Oscillospiraceae bacterium]|jgi:hypothetical protein|nr:hypothetical protein [Oscillospiraceae bacterium]
MKKLRIAIAACFVAAVAVTAAAMFSKHSAWLHAAHAAAVTATFLLIAAYLHLSAKYASVSALLELKASVPPPDCPVGAAKSYLPGELITGDCVILSGVTRVDEYARSGNAGSPEKKAGDTLYRGMINLDGAIDVMTLAAALLVPDAAQAGEPLFNPFGAALAASGIFVAHGGALIELAKARTIAPRGISRLREGFSKTRDTLSKAGVALSETESAGSGVALCRFTDFDPGIPISITHNKVAHLIKAVYYARRYVKLRRVRLAGLILCAVSAAALAATGQYMFMGITAAAYKAFCLYVLRLAEKSTEKRLTFSVFD